MAAPRVFAGFLQAVGMSPEVIAAYQEKGILALNKIQRFTLGYGFTAGARWQ